MKAAKRDAMSHRAELFDTRETPFGNTLPGIPLAPEQAVLQTKAREMGDDAVRTMRRRESLAREVETTGEAIRELQEMIARVRGAFSSTNPTGRTSHDA